MGAPPRNHDADEGNAHPAAYAGKGDCKARSCATQVRPARRKIEPLYGGPASKAWPPFFTKPCGTTGAPPRLRQATRVSCKIGAGGKAFARDGQSCSRWIVKVRITHPHSSALESARGLVPDRV